MSACSHGRYNLCPDCDPEEAFNLIDNLEARVKALEAELLEQARLNGLGSEREAEKDSALCGARDALERIAIGEREDGLSIHVGDGGQAARAIARQALFPFPRCGHEAEVEDLRKRLKDFGDHHVRMISLPAKDHLCEEAFRAFLEDMPPGKIIPLKEGQEPAKEGR